MLEAAHYLSVSYWTVRSWIEAGRLPACRLPGEGKLVRVDVRDLDELVEQCRDAPGPGSEVGR
jgi:excisionase family DNA binding protein